MTVEKIDEVKQGAKKVASELKEDTTKIIEDVTTGAKKVRADVANAVDHVLADATAEVAKLKADVREDQVGIGAAYMKADKNANEEKARSDSRREVTYAKAESDRARNINERKTADTSK